MAKTKRFSVAPYIITIIISLIFGLLGGAITNHQFVPYLVDMWKGEGSSQPVVEKMRQVVQVDEDSAVIDSVEKVTSSVVSIVATKDIQIYERDPFSLFFNNDFFGFPGMVPQQPSAEPKTEKRTVGGGTGFIITSDGLVLTNKHVISDTQAEYTVITRDGKKYSAEVASTDPLNDVAVVRIKAEEGSEKLNLPVVEFGNSSDLKPGQRVIAIGNALAEYENTVTVGVVSATNRQITAGDGQGQSETLTGLIQTDAAINPGNSGGPLVNLLGQVVGINTAIEQGATNIGFAIAIDDVKPVVESIQKHGRIIRPYLGVRFVMLNAEKAKELKLDVTHGALLVGDLSKKEFAVLLGSPAEKAGLKINDVLLSADGQDLTVDNSLNEAIIQHQVGDTITFKVRRDGKNIDIKVTLEEVPTAVNGQRATGDRSN